MRSSVLALARDETYDPFLFLPWQLHGAGGHMGGATVWGPGGRACVKTHQTKHTRKTDEIVRVIKKKKKLDPSSSWHLSQWISGFKWKPPRLTPAEITKRAERGLMVRRCDLSGKTRVSFSFSFRQLFQEVKTSCFSDEWRYVQEKQE